MDMYDCTLGLPYGVFTLPDTDIDTDSDTDADNGFRLTIVICRTVHTALTQTQINIEPIVVCIGVGVWQCECTITR